MHDCCKRYKRKNKITILAKKYIAIFAIIRLNYIYLHQKYTAIHIGVYLISAVTDKYLILIYILMSSNLKRLFKRKRILSVKECEHDLKDVLPLLNEGFHEALQKALTLVKNVPPHARCRGYEATICNSCLVEIMQKKFPHNWYWGKFKRFYIRIKNYIILIKKLNLKNMPMNIKTLLSNRINNQTQGELFGKDDNGMEPIVIFGYTKDDLGISYVPKLVYIDEGKLKWVIPTSDITGSSYVAATIKPVPPNTGIRLKTKNDSELKAE